MWHFKNKKNCLNSPSEWHSSIVAWSMTANVTINSISYIAAWVIDRIVEHIVSCIIRQVADGATGRVAAAALLLSGDPPLQGRLGCQPIRWWVGVTNQTEERGTVPETPGHAGGEKYSARVTELIEDQHEEDADGVGHQQLQNQQWRADQLVEVGFIDVPQQKQWGILHETQHIIHSHAIPV